ncbi:MAG TPA: hypothetical protein PLH27_16305 [bacterium]|nr:hypothetical protein [bacterium]HMW33034.1 hypothetical protein [bacterium]HMW35135.1 hypothetical protein [bacterium]HMY37572.1 hypothetical protein [bacterium]HMZ04940.1 hypothetical protein [bacterium]
MRPLYIINLILIALVSSCTYGYSASTDVTYSRSYAYKPHNRTVEIYFGDNKPSRAYRQVGLIEVQGGQYYSMDALVAKLRRQAQAIGADAVMDIRKSSTQRERGSLLDALTDEKPEIYTAPVITGIAIKYIQP